MNNEEFIKWRKSLNLSVNQMAKYVGVTANAIYRWESGSRQIGGAELKLIGMLKTVKAFYPEWHRKLMKELSE